MLAGGVNEYARPKNTGFGARLCAYLRLVGPKGQSGPVT